MSVPVPDAWALTSPAHASSRSLMPAPVGGSLSVWSAMELMPLRAAFTQWWMGIRECTLSFLADQRDDSWIFELLFGWDDGFRAILEAASRRKRSCLQWDDCTLIGLLILLYIPTSLLVHPESSVALTLLFWKESACGRTRPKSKHVTFSSSSACWNSTTWVQGFPCGPVARAPHCQYGVLQLRVSMPQLN